MIIMSTRYVLPTTSKLIFAPIGDIHHNAPGFDRDRFVDSIQWLRETSEKTNRKVIVPLMGDELELLSGSERRSYRASGLHGSTRAWMEQRMMEDLLRLYSDLIPIKHLIPHVIAGNHNFTFQESSVKTSKKYIGKSVSQVLAEMIGVPCLGICGVHVLELTQSERSTASFPFKIFMHHGFGVASSKAASIRQLIALKEKFPMCNLYIMGHNHVKIGTTTEGIDFRKNSRSGAWEMCASARPRTCAGIPAPRYFRSSLSIPVCCASIRIDNDVMAPMRWGTLSSGSSSSPSFHELMCRSAADT